MYIYIHIYLCIYTYIYIYMYIYIMYKNFAFFVYRNIVATYMHTGHTGFTFTYIKTQKFQPEKITDFFRSEY